MPKIFTKYKEAWEKEFKCLKAGPSEYEARCTDCNSIFSIKNGGHSDVKRHCSGIKHRKNCGECSDNSKNISDNSININEENYENNNNQIELTPEEQVMKAETLQALKVVSSNYSFASTTDDAERFRLMFPDSPTAAKYQQSRTKVNYVINKAISDGSKKLEQHLASKTLDAEKLHSDNELIQMGLQRKRKLADDLSNLKKKKNALLKSTK